MGEYLSRRGFFNTT